jgi:AcrR family transcriptional regulator
VDKGTCGTMNGNGASEPGASTRQRLLDAGQHLFAERGYEGTSLRGLAEAAEANIAAVNYHFRSKEGLLQAVIARAMAPVNAERERRLGDLLAAGAPQLEQLVRAFVEPGLDLAGHHGEQGPAVARFLGRVLFDPSPRIRQVFAEQVDPVEGRYLDALRQALPGHDANTFLFGYTSMLGLLALHQADAFAGIRWRRKAGPTDADLADSRTSTCERLIAFIVAGLTHGLAPEETHHGCSTSTSRLPRSS